MKINGESKYSVFGKFDVLCLLAASLRFALLSYCRQNTDQAKLCIFTLVTQWGFFSTYDRTFPSYTTNSIRKPTASINNKIGTFRQCHKYHFMS